MSVARTGSTAAVNATTVGVVADVVADVVAGRGVGMVVGVVVGAGADVVVDATVVAVVPADVDVDVGVDVAWSEPPHAPSPAAAVASVKQAEIARSRRIFLRLPAVLRAFLATIAATALVAACGGGSSHPDATSDASAVRTVSPTTRPPLTTTLAPTTTTAAPTTTTRPGPVTTAPLPLRNGPPTTAPARPIVPASRSQAQLIVVSASEYGQTFATLDAYDRTGSGWVRRFGPWTARVGRNGFAPAGQKREGDGRTPSGTYGFSFFFGIDANPGVSFSYRRITSSSIVWDDDPASPDYNEWIDTRVGAAGVRPEPMDNAPVYDYGAVIAYNTARTPGLGSAIFFHVSDGQSTAGCVALPVSELLDVLRWMNPAENPQMRMGVNAPAPA